MNRGAFCFIFSILNSYIYITGTCDLYAPMLQSMSLPCVKHSQQKLILLPQLYIIFLSSSVYQKTRQNFQKSSFFLRTTLLWNTIPWRCFPTNYNRVVFKSNVKFLLNYPLKCPISIIITNLHGVISMFS